MNSKQIHLLSNIGIQHCKMVSKREKLRKYVLVQLIGQVDEH